MANRNRKKPPKKPVQWPTENDKKQTTNTITNRKQTIQWPTENKQYNDQQKTNNTMANRNRKKTNIQQKIKKSKTNTLITRRNS
jgi:hypothetical protein